MKNRVFILAPDSRFNTESLERYGTRIYIYPRGFSNPFDVDSLALHIREALCDFNCEVDYLALTGHAAGLAVFTAVTFKLFPRLRLLMFDARTSAYRLRVLIGE